MFSMGHGIVPETAGWATFGWTLAVFLGTTVALALGLRSIIERLRTIAKVTEDLFVHAIRNARPPWLRDLKQKVIFQWPRQARTKEDEERARFTMDGGAQITQNSGQRVKRRIFSMR